MKLVIAVNDINLFNSFFNIAKEIDIELVNGKIERQLFDILSTEKIDGVVIQNNLPFCQRAIEYAKKRLPYVPIITYVAENLILEGTDISMPMCPDIKSETLFNITLDNINNYKRNFKKLKELFTKIEKPIDFGPCNYDPTLRTIKYNGSTIKISPKMGGLLQVLSMNYGKVVSKDIILEAVWEKGGDYFAGRSMDVYLTNLRKIFRENNIPLEIKNIQGRGLIIK